VFAVSSEPPMIFPHAATENTLATLTIARAALARVSDSPSTRRTGPVSEDFRPT
jgi:hypothetical protein